MDIRCEHELAAFVKGKVVAEYRALHNTFQMRNSKPKFCSNMDFRFITPEKHDDARAFDVNWFRDDFVNLAYWPKSL